MNRIPRLEAALEKLYNAFHNGTLNPECCKQCAVGTILDSTDSWKHFSDDHGSTRLNYIGRVHQTIGKKFNGYSPLELLRIEQAFLRGCGYQVPFHHKNFKPTNTNDTAHLFDGLCATISILYTLEGISNGLDISELITIEKCTTTKLKLKTPNPENSVVL
jgi:hypothetical protein